MIRKPTRMGASLKKVVALSKQHSVITSKQIAEAIGATSSVVSKRMGAWVESGWFIRGKEKGTFSAGPRVLGERVYPAKGTDEWLLLERMKHGVAVDLEDAEIAIDDVPERVKKALNNLRRGGWIEPVVIASDGFVNSYRMSPDPFISKDVKARVDRVVQELREGLRKFN